MIPSRWRFTFLLVSWVIISWMLLINQALKAALIGQESIYNTDQPSFHHLSFRKDDERKQGDWSRLETRSASNGNDSDLGYIPPDYPFRSNSRSWLLDTRLSNQIETDNFIFSQVAEIDLDPYNLSTIDFLMDRTLCHKNGRFRSPSEAKWDVHDSKLIDDWTFRLTYLAIHSWHHAPARREAWDRRDSREDRDHMKSGFEVPPFDFECRNTKFLITNMQQAGMGASFRLGAVSSMLMGIATGRITVFLNNVNSSKVPSMLADELWLTRCDRSDMQCTFLPTTPCVVTLEDLEINSITIPHDEAQHLRRTGEFSNSTMAAHPYLIMTSLLYPTFAMGIHHKVRSALFIEASGIVAALRMKRGGLASEMFTVLEKALNQLKLAPLYNKYGTSRFQYHKRYSFIHHAALLYTLRLQQGVRNRVARQVDKILQRTKNFNPELAIGLPIRESDKCEREMICPPFEMYMNLASEIWQEHFPRHEQGTIVVTTESSSVANSSRFYAASPLGTKANLSIVMNEEDVLQDTGLPWTIGYHTRADAVMESTLIAMSLQMHTKFNVGNCCSNFHVMLFDLLQHGCGLSTTQLCLQETINPAYHVCCKFTETDQCRAQFTNRSISSLGTTFTVESV